MTIASATARPSATSDRPQQFPMFFDSQQTMKTNLLAAEELLRAYLSGELSSSGQEG